MPFVCPCCLQLRFFYHQYGQHGGSLAVSVYEFWPRNKRKQYQVFWNYGDKKSPWTQVLITLPPLKYKWVQQKQHHATEMLVSPEFYLFVGTWSTSRLEGACEPLTWQWTTSHSAQSASAWVSLRRPVPNPPNKTIALVYIFFSMWYYVDRALIASLHCQWTGVAAGSSINKIIA